MLNIILHDIYCLKRVHAIFPDQVLGHTLKDKILRINLKPALEEVKYKSQDTVLLSSMKRRVQTDDYNEEMENESIPSSTNISLSNSAVNNIAAECEHNNVNKTGSNTEKESNGADAASLVNNDMIKAHGELLGSWSGRFVAVPNPSSLANLLECLAYFELGQSAITHDTLKLIEFILPYMTINQLSNTLAAACALGEQGVTVPTTALLNAALHVNGEADSFNKDNRERNESNKMQASISPAYLRSTRSTAWRSEFDHSEIGRNVIRLMKALQRAEVKQEEIWALIAEHCVRYMHFLTPRQLLNVVEIFSAEQMTYYPDFYIATEQYIISQPANFMNMEQLQRMVNYFKAVNQPVMLLLSLSTNRFDAGFEQSLNALANITQRSGFMEKEQALHDLLPYTYGKNIKTHVANSIKHLSPKESIHTESTRKDKTEETQKEEKEEYERKTESNEEEQHSHLSSKENAVVTAFLNVAIPAFSKANGSTLLHLLIQCDEKKIMHARLIEAAIYRVQELYFYQSITRTFSSSDAENTSTPESVARADRKVKFARIAQEILPHDINQMTILIEHILYFLNPAFFVNEKTTTLLMDMLDAIANRTIEHFHHRLLKIAECACQLVPEELLPRHYFAVLITYLKETRDMVTTTLINSARVELFVRSLLQLKPYGGVAVIEYYLPIITVEASKSVLHVQVSLAEMLATLPAAKSELLPSLFRGIVGQKRWAMTLIPQEIGMLLRAMRNGGVRHAGLLAGMMQIMTSRRQLFHGHDVVEYLVHLAILGEREVEFFTTMATYVLESGNSGGIANNNNISRNSKKKKSKIEINESANREGMSILQHSTSVHDLCTLLYVFTFIVKDVIRVVQQILARLKVSVSQVNAEDVVKVLYSLVKLHVTRHYEITNPLCDRMVKLCHSYTAQELSSVWSSLRALNFYHAAFTEATRNVMEAEAIYHIMHMALHHTSAKQHGSNSEESVTKPKMSDKTFVGIISAMMQITISNVEYTQMSTCTQTISQGQTNTTSPILSLTINNSKSNTKNYNKLIKTSQELHYDQLHDNSSTTQIKLLQNSHPFSNDVNVHVAFKEATVRLFESMIIHTKFVEQPLHGINNRVAPREMSGLHICLAINTLVYLTHIELTEYEWNVLASVANYFATFLTRGNAETNCFAAVDTLIALTRLRQQWSERFATREECENNNISDSTSNNRKQNPQESSYLETLLQEYTNHWLDHIPTELLRLVQDKHKIILTSQKVRNELRELGLLSRITGHNDLHHQTGGSNKRSLYNSTKRDNLGNVTMDSVSSTINDLETEIEKATASAHAFWHATAVQEQVPLTTPLINKRVKKSEDMVTRLRKGAHVAKERKRLTSTELEERLSSINTEKNADISELLNVKDADEKTKVKQQTQRLATDRATKSKLLTTAAAPEVNSEITL